MRAIVLQHETPYRCHERGRCVVFTFTPSEQSPQRSFPVDLVPTMLHYSPGMNNSSTQPHTYSDPGALFHLSTREEEEEVSLGQSAEMAVWGDSVCASSGCG